MPPPAVSLVVPCFDEAEALEAFGPLLEVLDVEEVVFVDDGSTDGTPAALARFARADPRIRVVTHDRNRGVGAAMRTGLEASTGDVVVVYDADRTYPPEDVARLVAAVEGGADVATASPWAEGGGAPDVPWRRRFLSRGAARAYRRALGPASGGLRTFTCAFRAYARAWVPRLLPESDGFAAAAEMLGRALLAGAVVVEVPSVLTDRREGRSKMRVVAAIRGHLRTLRRLRRLRRSARVTQE